MEKTTVKDTYIELTEEQLLKKFTFIRNSNDDTNREGIWGCRFSIGGVEETFIENINPAHVWTIVRSTDNSNALILGSGKRYCNRVHYLVSIEPVPEGFVYGGFLAYK